MTIGRKDRVGWSAHRLHIAKGDGFLVRHRVHPERNTGPFDHPEKELVSIRRPRLRSVRRSRFWRRQSGRLIGVIGALPEDSEIALSVRLVRHMFAIRGPDGKLVS